MGLKGGAQISRKTRFWILGFTFLLALATGSIAWELINPVSMVFRGLIFGMGFAWGVVLAVFLLDFAISRRAWCGSLCPVGAFYSLLGAKSTVRVNAYQRDQCNDCMDCFIVCPEQQVIKNPLKGAKKGFSSLITSGQCTNCGRCIDVCAEDVFRFETRLPIKITPSKEISIKITAKAESLIVPGIVRGTVSGVASLVLGLGLSTYSLNAFAASEEAVAPAVTEEAPAAMEAPAITPEFPAVTESAVKSATPPMTNIDFKGVNSLRGGSALDKNSDAADIKLLPADSLPIARNYFQQPPLIPHRIREYKITVRNNKCMTCHSWKTYKKAKATKVSQTHFEDRDGNAQSTLAARRYFCTQCHVPQVDAKPLIENNFKPVSDLNN
ncbi:Methylamine utilization ferredoxin-type protein MauN [Nymphon striatum]|nr:Methylamine utilization ferredoxin-type protein MauN [Nymphon striatum]